MIIAIDGPAGSGKSTVAKLVATKLGFHYLDTGAMYRAVAVRALDNGFELSDEPALAEIAASQKIGFEHEGAESLPTRVLIGGEDVTDAIRTPRADEAVSVVARSPKVRTAMVEQQRAIGRASNIVVEGRDIGTVVFPDAEVKVFLTASAEERARRRAAQNAARGMASDAAATLEAMKRRDKIDTTREVSPLTLAEDAIQLDTTGLSIEQVVEAIAKLAAKASA
ncbi:MAG TPA: (d)CMP kinase [Coriobacteriia bacterium]|nr:(d)CMP kinase [Coriobacteriia bacterium]